MSDVKNVSQSKKSVKLQGGITVCSLQCNMVGSCHLVRMFARRIYKTMRYVCSTTRQKGQAQWNAQKGEKAFLRIPLLLSAPPTLVLRTSDVS